MPVFQAWLVTCDECGGEALTQEDTCLGARRSARDRGWYVGRDGTVLCPDCDGENE